MKFFSGMRGFTLLWLGQVVSILGSAMTWFAFTIWAWEKTGKTTALATISFAAFLPGVLLSPLAGVFVDRWNRKLVMILSDLAMALGTLIALVIYTFSDLQIWHIAVISTVAGFFTAFQYPAYAAAVTTMLTKDDYARAQGMLGSARALSGILAPVFAAALLNVVHLNSIMLIDLATFVVAFLTLAVIQIPQPAQTMTGLQGRGAVSHEIAFGFRYILEDQGLKSLTILFILAGIFIAIGSTLTAPLVLSQTQNNQAALATVQSAGAIGGITGGVLLSVWGGARKRVHNILLGGMAACLLGILGLGLSRAVLFWVMGNFFFAFFEPFVEGGNLSIWQTKVPADVQGRVFSARQLLVQIPYLFGILISGFLAEGRAISSVLILAGIAGAVVFLAGYFVRSVSEVEVLDWETT